MITFMILLFSVVSIFVDYYIIRRHLWHNLPHVFSWIDMAITFVFTLSVIATAVSYKYVIADPQLMGLVTWIIFFFIMSMLSRTLFCLCSLVGWAFEASAPRVTRTMNYVGLAFALGVISVMSYGATWGRSEIRVERVEILSDRLPREFDGFRIVQFSDTHLGNWGSNTAVIEDMVEQINSLNPDIVVQSGDLVNIVSEEFSDRFMEIFARIKAPVYSVLGNHDLGFYVYDTIANNPNEIVTDLIARQRKLGWTVLINENTWLHRGSDSMLIAGVSYPNNIAHNGYNSHQGGSDLAKAMRGALDDDFSILISHSPKLFDSVPDIGRADLTLSGHVHAMQAKVEIGDWKFSPAQWLYPLYSGLYIDRGHHLYINDGIGYVLYPMRIGAKPELTIFTLKTKR